MFAEWGKNRSPLTGYWYAAHAPVVGVPPMCIGEALVELEGGIIQKAGHEVGRETELKVLRIVEDRQ